MVSFIHTIKYGKTGQKWSRFLKYTHIFNQLSTSYPQNVDNITSTVVQRIMRKKPKFYLTQPEFMNIIENDVFSTCIKFGINKRLGIKEVPEL